MSGKVPMLAPATRHGTCYLPALHCLKLSMYKICLELLIASEGQPVQHEEVLTAPQETSEDERRDLEEICASTTALKRLTEKHKKKRHSKQNLIMPLSQPADHVTIQQGTYMLVGFLVRAVPGYI